MLIKDWLLALEDPNATLQQQLRSCLSLSDGDVLPVESKLRVRDLLAKFTTLYACEPDQDVGLFSAPGRTELIGNHTDHQRGEVMAAAVNLDILACVRENDETYIRFHSEGWPQIVLDLTDLAVRKEDYGTTLSLLRGVVARYVEMGYPAKGLDIYCVSDVLPGSGLSSSAACEVLLAVIANHYFAQDSVDAIQWAMIGQYAENQYFGKPSGLMDQMASAVGAAVYINFADVTAPRVEALPLDLKAEGYALCIVDSGADHANLTSEYAAIPQEMCAVARACGKEVLQEVEEETFYLSLPQIRSAVGDRALLRALHYFAEVKRVQKAAQALRSGDFSAFLAEVNASGKSSQAMLQNISVAGAKEEQALALALALAEHYLQGEGAYRVHGGGFAGTIQAFVPLTKLAAFKRGMEEALGAGSCHVLQVREVGGLVFGR